MTEDHNIGGGEEAALRVNGLVEDFRDGRDDLYSVLVDLFADLIHYTRLTGHDHVQILATSLLHAAEEQAGQWNAAHVRTYHAVDMSAIGPPATPPGVRVELICHHDIATTTGITADIAAGHDGTVPPDRIHAAIADLYRQGSRPSDRPR